ncbi:MAG TPA: hypothetical protein VK217_03585 [Acidimicrobiales bacterium]|nr:hypothetical protein [Acidimicrobiales bacterium]
MTQSESPRGHLRRRALRAVCDRLGVRLERRDDSGQTIVIVLVLLILLAALAPIMARQVTSDTPLLALSTNKHAALAAAEAGIQWYRDNLDSYSAYYTYSAANNPTHDAALSGWCGAGLASTCDLGGTTPPEAFHYVPNDSYLFSQTGSAAGTVVLTVTGRAGTAGNYVYINAQASFSTNSILDDAYYSSYEVLDPASQTIQGINVTSSTSGGPSSSTPETQFNISYSYTNGAGTTVNVNNVSVWQAACQYETYNENNFVDSLGLTIGGTTYSYGHPYYGPYLENSGFTFNVNGSGVVTSGGATLVTVPAFPCQYPFDFVNGESFNGPVYTNDQLHVCGSPSFNGSPVSLTSGAPSNVPYLYDVPGSVLVTAANSGSNGPYPTSLIGHYVPAGYTVDTVNCGGGGASPTLAHGVALNGAQSLPSLNTELAADGTSTPPSGVTGTGCTYVGPTMIELAYSGGTTTMNVWSPLSTNTTITSAVCSNNSTFSAANPFITGIALPTDGVVYVEDYQLGSTLPTVPGDGSTPCFNPYEYADSATSPQCYEGDVYIEGELHGQLTVASSANIMVTRNLTYQCADGGGGASATNPASVTACTSSATPDILGLDAKYDVLISHNDPGNPLASTATCTYDGTGTPTNTGTRINGTSYPNDPNAVWPTVCDPNGSNGIIVDAAVFALNGSFGDENWDQPPYSNYVNLNGTDLSFYRGPFGIEGTDGYEKNFSFDQRLEFATPPYALPGGVPLWQDDDYVVCPNISCPAIG